MVLIYHYSLCCVMNKVVKETIDTIEFSHPWPFPNSDGKKVITPLTAKVRKAKTKHDPFERNWVPALI